MANKRVTDLTATTAIDGTEELYVVEDPSGTPVDRKVTTDDLVRGVGDGAYEAHVDRTGSTTGDVPTLQGDGTLAFEAPTGGGGAVSSVDGETGAVDLTDNYVALAQHGTQLGDSSLDGSNNLVLDVETHWGISGGVPYYEADPADVVAGEEAIMHVDAYGTVSWMLVSDIDATDKTPAGVLADLLTVDGAGSGLDADKVDGNEASALLARANHTGTQSADTITDGTTNKAYTATEQTKLAGVETGATADQTAAEILTAIKTVDGSGSGLDADTLDGANVGTASGDIATLSTGGRFDIARLASGTPDGSKFVRDDGTLATPAGGGSVSDTAYAGSWDGDTTTAPSKNAVYDKVQTLAPLASPTFTGTPAAPTAGQGTNTTQVATTAYVQTEAGLLIPKSLIDAAGDLIIGTADNTVARMAIGTVGGKAVVADPNDTNKISVQYPHGVEAAVRGSTGSLASTFDRRTQVVAGLGTALATGRLSLYCILLPKGITASSITVYSSTQAAVSPTNQWFGLFDSSRVPLRLTNDDTTTAWAASSPKTLSLSSNFQTTYAGWYYIGIMVKASTVPSLIGVNGLDTTTLRLADPIVGGTSSTGLTDPASCPNPAGAITVTSTFVYAEVA